MSTPPLVETPLGPFGGHGKRRSAASTATGSSLSVFLGVALLLLVGYAAFSHGATSLTTGARVQVVLAAIALVAGTAWLWGGGLRFSTPALAAVGLGLLAAFAAWCGVTLLWSVAPDRTWIELNRAITYVIVLFLAILLGASDRRAIDLTAIGFLVVALGVTVYALGQKLLPGLHIQGVFDLNQTGLLPRLQEPFGYWNALGLFVVLAVPGALMIATDRTRAKPLRLSAVVALELLLLALAFTYSRGAMIAVVLALVIGIAVSGARLRVLMWLAVACLASLAPLVVGLTSHSLTAAYIPLANRESAGGLLLGVLLASLVALAVATRWLFALEEKVTPSPARVRNMGRVLVALAVLAAIVGVLALALSSRGVTGSVSHAWHSFTTTRATSVYEPNRLLSADSENRWVWWKEAAGAFSDRPLTGWGAGAFPVVHLLYRRNTLSVTQPHSVPLQFLAETGLLGALAALLGLGLLIAAAWRLVIKLPSGGHRLLASALLAGAAAYLIHALYDWDWDIPGVTFPALLFLGVLTGTASRVNRRRRPMQLKPAAPLRLFGLVTLTLCVCAFAASAVLPSLAASKAGSAVVAAASRSPAVVHRAQSAAALASSLDPLSDAGPRVEATIALRRHQLLPARRYLLEAIAREPTDGEAWRALSLLEVRLGRSNDAMQAAARVLALDPRGLASRSFAANIVQLINALQAPPKASPTAQPSPA